MTLEHFAAPVTDLEPEAGTVVARVIPYGVTIEHRGESIRFEPGSVTVPELVPVNVDHEGGTPSRIGRVESTQETDEGLYARIRLSDTSLGRDVRTLLLDGVVTDVSAGVAIDSGREAIDDGVRLRAGELDHVAIVGAGAFGDHGSKVLSVHSEDDDQEVAMAEKTEATEVVEHEKDDGLAVEVAELRRAVVDLAENRVADEPNPLERYSLDEVLKAMIQTQHRGSRIELMDPEKAAEIARYALADDTTTSSAGVVPDFQSSEIISIVDADRAYISEHPRDPIGPAGMTVDYPTVTTKPSVDVQLTEKTEVDSTQTVIGTTSVDLRTVAGASDVAIQLIERSSPSFLSQLAREYAHVYATHTEAAATAAAVAGAGGTAVLADLGANAAATQAAILTANTAIIAAVRRPMTHIFLAPDRWEQLMSLADSTGRPLVATTPASERYNAPGVAVGNAMVGEYLGAKVVLVPDAATGTCLIENVDRGLAILEQSPQELRALQVDLLGWNVGLYSYFAEAVKYAGGLYTLTLV